MTESALEVVGGKAYILKRTIVLTFFKSEQIEVYVVFSNQWILIWG